MRHSGHAVAPRADAAAATMETAAYASPGLASPRPPWRRRALPFLPALFLALSLGLAPLPAAAVSFLERAQQYFEEGDLRSAAVELKNALQRSPNHAAARFLLGQVHLRSGNIAGAEKELLRARDLGYQGEDFELTFSYLRLRQGRFHDVVTGISEEIAIESELQKDLYVARGEALLGLGQFDRAQAVFDRILREGGHVRALVNNARIAMVLDDPEAARDFLDQAAAIDPDDPLLVTIDAGWLYHAKRFVEAKNRFARAVELEPNELRPYLGQIQAHLALGEIEQADQLLQYLKANQPNDVLIVLQDSIIQFLRRNYRKAKSAADRVLAANNKQPHALLVAGYSAYRLGEYEQARSQLLTYLAQRPQDYRARLVLSAALLRLGYPEDAYGTLSEFEGEITDSLEYLGALTGAAFGAGDREAGLKYLERLAAKSPDAPEIQERLGRARMQAGDAAGAKAALERSIALAPGHLSPYTRLFAIHLQQKDMAQALEIARNIKARFPDNSAGNTFLGIAYVVQGDLDQARAALRSAVDQDPGNIEAASNLVSILRLEGESAAARAVLEGVLVTAPGHLQTLLAYADLESQAGNQARAEELWRQAMSATPLAAPPRVFLGRAALEAGRLAEALALAEPGLAEHPNDVGLLETVGLARRRGGDHAGALEAFELLATRLPKNARVQEYLMFALERNDRVTEALAAADAVLQLDPTSFRARVARLRYLAQLGRLAEAKDALKPLRQKYPDRADLFLVEGRIALAEQRIEDAVAVLESAFKLQPSNTIAVELARALIAADRDEEGFAFLHRWLQKHPKDLPIHTVLAKAHLARGQLQEARDRYQIILGLVPDHIQALGNLASIKVRLGEVEEAVLLAREGLRLDPDNGQVAYVLARALLETGEREEALKLLQALRNATKNHTGVRFHFARALAANGQSKRAISELEALLAENMHFSHRTQAEALLETVSR